MDNLTSLHRQVEAMADKARSVRISAPPKPVHLQHYDTFGSLRDWVDRRPDGSCRRWDVESREGGTLVQCRLVQVQANGTVLVLVKTHHHGEAAVFDAIHDFDLQARALQ